LKLKKSREVQSSWRQAIQNVTKRGGVHIGGGTDLETKRCKPHTDFSQKGGAGGGPAKTAERTPTR